ncbi:MULTISPECIES: serine/threonine-protein kinase [unclassified Exiguobacterium]|uniref:serine/threonine-protein kinase n=1 Tax=unclassified Exiguobacterium TaxID=2644629 RepID=UPI001BE88A58|nr:MULTISPECIES: serine/threonine-protein kinase [unclassified Exiguobacterium]
MNEAILRQKISSEFEGINLLEKIGEGGQKTVFKFENGNSFHVMKLIKINEANSLLRANRELDIAETLKSSYFPEVYDHGEIEIGADSYLYVIEEFVEGESLRNYILKQDYEFKDVLNIGINLLNALELVHSKQLVHRDIKPENIIIHNNKITLLDFGIARDLTKESLTADVAFWGPMTIGYAAPEQILNQKKIICDRTDIFSWGVLMYELSTGTHPFRKDGLSNMEVIENTLKLKVPKLETPNEAFNNLVFRSMNKELHRRPISVTKIIEKLN